MPLLRVTLKLERRPLLKLTVHVIIADQIRLD